MQVNFNTISFNPLIYKRNQKPSFQGKASVKFLEKLKTADNLKHVKASFDEMVRAYNELGYDVIHKRGSHAVVIISDKIRLSLIHPHGNKKGIVTITEIKKLKYVALGEIEKARAME